MASFTPPDIFANSANPIAALFNSVPPATQQQAAQPQQGQDVVKPSLDEIQRVVNYLAWKTDTQMNVLKPATMNGFQSETLRVMADLMMVKNAMNTVASLVKTGVL